MCLCVRFCVSIVVITLLSFEQFADAAFDSAQICSVTLLLFKFYVHYLSLSRSTFMVGAHVCSEHITWNVVTRCSYVSLPNTANLKSSCCSWAIIKWIFAYCNKWRAEPAKNRGKWSYLVFCYIFTRKHLGEVGLVLGMGGWIRFYLSVFTMNVLLIPKNEHASLMEMTIYFLHSDNRCCGNCTDS